MNPGKRVGLHPKPAERGRIIIYLLLTFFAVLYLIPIYILIVTSFKSFSDVSLSRMWQLPRSWSLASFKEAWMGNPAKGFPGLGRLFMNSVYVAIPATVISTLIGSVNAYVFAKWRFRGADTIFTLMLFGMFIPYQSIIIPLVQVFRKLGLYGSLGGLGAAHVIYGIPLTTLIFRNYYSSVPSEVVESARVDGANFFMIYRSIVLPLSLPALAVAGIWQFTAVWNSYLFPIVLTQRPAVQPITVGLVNIAGSYFVEWNVQMAGGLLTALPTLLVYILLGRYFIQGMMAGSIKG